MKESQIVEGFSASKTEERISSVEKMKKILTYIYLLPEKEMFEAQKKIVEHVKKIKTNYPNYSDYKIYHVLSGSTIRDSRTDVEENDFPGEYSVENFLENLAREYGFDNVS
jgi:hypothetical protein